MPTRSKAQFAIEFIVLLGFMFLIFVGFIAIMTSKVSDSKDNEMQEIAENIATLVKNEVQLAKSVTDGYNRTFKIPNRVNGILYSIDIIDNRELVVNYADKEYVTFLPERVCGDVFMPINEIDKKNGIICANSNLDQTQCQNAELLGLCDSLEEELLPGTKCCCWLRYGICGPP